MRIHKILRSITRGFFLPILAFAGILCSCPREPRAPEKSPTENELAGEDFIAIGVAIPLTGATAGFGSAIQKGIDLAVKELNKKGGIYKKKFAVFYEDTEGKSSFAGALARKLVQAKGVDFLIGSASSAESIEMAKAAEELQVPLVVPVATNPLVTIDESGAIRKHTFRVCFTDELQGKAIIWFARNVLKAKRIAILWDASSSYSKHLREVILREVTNRYPDIKVAADESYVGGGVVSSFKPSVDALFQAGFDTLLLPAYYADAVGIVREVRARGAKVNIVGSDGLGSYEFLREGGSAVEGVYLTNHFSADYGGKLAKDFVEKFYEDYEVVPDAISALAYDSMMLLAKAIETAQTLDRDAVTAALANTKNFEGVSGVITIGNDHNPIKNVFVERISELKFKFVRTITPEELEKK